MTDRLFRAAGPLLLLSLAPVLGCESKSTAPPTVTAAQEVSKEPGEVELSEPQVKHIAPNMVEFEVKYRFTKGKPDKHYMLEIKFPGTNNQGSKPMQNWQLEPEGIIKDSVTLGNPPVTTFEIILTEAVSPDDGYEKISNVVSGPVK